MIELTSAAIQEIKRMQNSRQQPNSYFRLGVKPGGCDGLYYTFDLSETKENSDRLQTVEDISLLIDEHSLNYLSDLRLDYAEDLMGGGFRFHNPLIATSCRCGLSFTLKES
ncbi:iron-sulfur cluster assembly accessory protein [Cyanothece sp. BG0011]|uniref:HesB/IscA family protein n=1 Tax=Cyanothece sp. BG0011 TaxID=2082950 RepID=UPI000D1E4BCC|nr:iron-sulfur cluster assembly accessory protein [Cyanothece sp. BG0011]